VHRGDDRVLGAAAQPRRMAVLAMVARAGSRGISRDRLLSTLWPDADDEQGRNALKQAIYALRREADLRELFLGTRELRLNPDEVVCDVAEFEELFRHNEYERAVSLYEGPFLDGFRLSAVPEFEQWVEEERRALGRALAVGLDRLARTALEQGDPVAAVRWRRRLTALEPLNARFTVDLMTSLLAAGDRAGALQQARIYEGLIAQELDLPPDDSVIDLANGIREGRIAPAAAPVRTPPRATPPGSVASPTPAPQHAAPLPRTAPAVDATPTTSLSVAVLPFSCLSGDVDAGHLADGLTEEVIYALGRMHDLRVTGRVAGSLAGDGTPDVAAIGARYGVSAVLEGSVRRGGDDVRVAARLLGVRDGTLIWSERYDRRVENTLALQDQLARAIAAGVESDLRREAGLPQAPSLRERADELYALGLRAWTPQGAGLGQGLEQFRQAVAIDPEHARAHAALAESYTQLAFYGFLPALRAADLVDSESREAMRLAPDIAESHLARGTSLLWVHREFAAGTAELERALEIDPTFVVAQARLAFVRLCHDGPVETDRAVAHRAATMAGATGLSRVMYGQQLLAARRYGEAVDALHAAIDIEAPSFLAYHWLTAAYVQMGRGAEAVAAAVAEASISDRHPWALTSLVVACALAGQVRRAETLLETLKSRAATGYVQASLLGMAHAALGDIEAGMTLLERGVEEHDPSMMMLKIFPMYDPFREHPRFPALLRAAGWREEENAAVVS
jgi:TolB-like protein/DNA-binding SARP family transcriptional activator/Tfp pilus assembly protein PilF